MSKACDVFLGLVDVSVIPEMMTIAVAMGVCYQSGCSLPI
jgi:hypothetical protein